MDKPDSQTKCTVCKRSNNSIIFQKGSFCLNSCSKCGTVFLGEYSDVFVPDLYSYYDKYANLEKENVFDPITSDRCRDLLIWFSTFGFGKEVLDVGCGLGQFVEVADRSGWIAEGLELSKGAVDFARRQGVAVRDLDFLSEEIKPNSYDLVTFFEVIEHVPNPAEFVHRAGEVVRPGGLVYLTTPNFASLDRYLLGADWNIIHPEHLTYFTPHTLRSLVKKTGFFEILHFETRNLSMAVLQVLSFGLYPRISPMANYNDGLETGCDCLCQMNDLRGRMESSSSLGLAKRFVNKLLNAAGLGVAMSMLLHRSPEETVKGDKQGSASKAFGQAI